MRLMWSITIISTLVSLGLLIITTGQHQMMGMRNEEYKRLGSLLERVKNQETNEFALKDSLEDLVKKGKTAAEALEAEVNKVGSEQQKRKAEVDTCQAEKEAKHREVADAEAELNKIKENLKAESDVWNVDKNKLTPQLTEYRQMCPFVKDESMGMKLCGTPPPMTPHQAVQ